MTISYPLTMPTEPGVTRVRLFQSAAVAINESPWTFASQIQVHPGQRWGAEVTLPIMTRPQAEQWQCFLLQLNGMAGTFYLGDPLHTEPRGNWAGNPLVNGASQTGQVLNLNGFVPGATVEPGDHFQVGLRLYKYIGTSTAVADGSGQVSLDIWPRLRESPSNGQSLITFAPKGLFRLASNEYDIFSSHAMEYYEISFSAIEAL